MKNGRNVSFSKRNFSQTENNSSKKIYENSNPHIRVQLKIDLSFLKGRIVGVLNQ